MWSTHILLTLHECKRNCKTVGVHRPLQFLAVHSTTCFCTNAALQQSASIFYNQCMVYAYTLTSLKWQSNLINKNEFFKIIRCAVFYCDKINKIRLHSREFKIYPFFISILIAAVLTGKRVKNYGSAPVTALLSAIIIITTLMAVTRQM